MRKIIGGGLHLLGIGGKKKAAATPAAETKGPVLSPLGPGAVPPNRKRTIAGQPSQRPATLLGGSDRLGG